MESLFVFDLTDTLVAVLDAKDEVGPFENAVHMEQLNRENTFNFQVPANNAKAQFVVEGNSVAFKDLDGDFQLFEIKRVEEIHEDILLKEVFCEHAVFELLDELILFSFQRNQSATTILTEALTGTEGGATRWFVGTVNVPGTATVRMELDNPINVFKKMITAFGGGEFSFSIFVSGTQITGRFVNFLQQRGTNTGKRFEYEKDVNSIRREVDFSNVKTRLFGFGKAQEVPGGIRRVRFSDITGTEAGITRTKPLGDEFLDDPAALAKWGRDGMTRHRIGFFEDPDIVDPVELLIRTDELLDQLKDPQLSYEMKVTDLERFSGLAHEKVRLGDTVKVIDRTFNPALIVETRVIEIKRFITEPEKDELVLDNFRPLSVEDGEILRDIQTRVNGTQGVWKDEALITNMVNDHSFENVPRIFGGGSPDADQVFNVSKTTADSGSPLWWDWSGTGKVISTYNDTTLLSFEQLALFDFQAAVIETDSKPFQFVPLANSVGTAGPYTASCYVSAYAQTTVDGTARLEIYATDATFTRLNGGVAVGVGTQKIIAANKNDWKRNIVTITNALPVGTVFLEIFITIDSGDPLLKYLADGVQMVPLDSTVTYQPESQLFRHMRRFPGLKLQFPTILGDLLITDGFIRMTKPDTFRAFQSGAQALTAGVWNKITFDTEDYDVRFSYDNVTNFQFTASDDGFFLVNGNVRIDNLPDGQFAAMAIFKNNAVTPLEIIDVKVVGSLNDPQLSGSSSVKLLQNDFIDIRVFPQSGVNTRFGTDQTHFKVFRLG